jgi:hypothetical protein
MEQLKDPLGSVEITERMLAKIAQACSFRERVQSEVLGDQGKEYLSAVAGSDEASESVEPWSKVVAILRRGGCRVKSHADL